MTANDTSQIERVIARLLSALGHAEIVLSAEGTLGFRYDDRFDVSLEVDARAGVLHVFADLGDAAIPDPAGFLAHLLAANVSETGAARFALDPASGRVLYCYAHPASDLDEIGLQTILENLLAECIAWQARLLEISTGGDAGTEGKPPPPSRFIRA